MKKTLIISFILVFCFSLTGCQQKIEKDDILKEKQEEKIDFILNEPAELNEIDGVLMRIKEGTLTRTSATIVIYDYTKEDNIYGSAYRIDQKKNGKWVSLKTIDGKDWTEIMWTLIGYRVDEHDRLEIKIGWEKMYGPLEDGEYRIVKSTSNQNDSKERYFSVEFILK